MFVSTSLLTFLKNKDIHVYASSGFENDHNGYTHEKIEISPECAAVALVGGSAMGGVAAMGLASSSFIGILGIAGGALATWWDSTLPLIVDGNLLERLQSITILGLSEKQYVLEKDLGGRANLEYFQTLCQYVDKVDPETSTGKAVGMILMAARNGPSVSNVGNYVTSFRKRIKDWVNANL